MNNQGGLVIAIDGTAASGKGTLAKRMADQLGLRYLDTGSIYRALGYAILKNGADPADYKVAVATAKQLDYENIDNAQLYCEGVGAAASIVAAIPQVREVLIEFQRNFTEIKEGAVLDGRDIGTVICPDADFKFFITAKIEARAKRRYKQLQSKGNKVIYEDVLRDLCERDERDSRRSVAPLVAASGAVCIDTTDMTADEVFNEAMKVVKPRVYNSC